MNKLVVGCGYLGSRVAARWLADGSTVFATTRSPKRAERLRQQGFLPLVADVTDPQTLRSLPHVDTVLYAVGFDRRSDKSMREIYVDGLRRVLESLPAENVSKFLYISSTGVYGSSGGAWIDETSPCRPEREGGRVCLAAEEALRARPLGAGAVVLRLAGIYGPGRIPSRAAILAGSPVAADPEAHLNLIHVDDAVEAVLAAERRAPPGSLYLVSDGHPPLRREFYREVTRLWDVPVPTFVPPSPREAPARRGGEDKRISNRRLLDELQLRLSFDNYRDGLAHIRASDMT